MEVYIVRDTETKHIMGAFSSHASAQKTLRNYALDVVDNPDDTTEIEAIEEGWEIEVFTVES